MNRNVLPCKPIFGGPHWLCLPIGCASANKTFPLGVSDVSASGEGKIRNRRRHLFGG